MKKNITMNLFGTLYAIDEDAYDLLNSYLNNMKQYFSSKEGGEEIADDIEHRMAELLDELKSQGVEAINIDHVKKIIERIGNPEEMEGFEKQAPPSDEEKSEGHKGAEWFRKHFSSQGRKKLFRNPDDQIVKGVLSGIACYCEIDPIWIRLATILLFFCSYGSVVLAYLILYLVIPLARTPEDRLMMKGIPVNMENLHEEIINETRQQGSGNIPKHPSILSMFFKIIITLVLCVLFLSVGYMLLLTLILFCIIIFALTSGSGNMIADFMGNEFTWIKMFLDGNSSSLYWIAILSSIMLLVLTLYLIGRIVLNITGRVKPLSTAQRMTYIVSWIILLIICCASLTHCAMLYKNYEHADREQKRTIQDSIVRSKDSVYLAQRGWRIVKSRNCKFYTNRGFHYTGDKEKRYIAGQADDNLLYEVEKTAKVTPGTYRLKAMARTNGYGCRIFLLDGKKQYTAKVPVCDNIGGNLWEKAVNHVEKDGEAVDSVVKCIAKANHNKGYGWNEIAIGPIAIKNPTVRYGITNDCPDEAWTGTWFTATEFSLEKIEETR